MSYASKPFPANYAGTCGECGDRIDEGDDICMLEGAAVHEDCVPSDQVNPYDD